MTNDLLERRAERGRPRGAAVVWSQAHQTASTGNEAGAGLGRRRTHTPFRLILLGLIVSVTGAMVVGLSGVGEWSIRQPDRTDQADGTDEGGGDEDSDRLVPPPIAVEGFDRTEVHGPPPVEPPDRAQATRHLIYADPTDPWSGPIVGLEQLSGGFRMWGANLDTPVEEWDWLVVRTEAGWGLDPLSDLELLAEVESNTDWLFESWQLTFSDGDTELVLQAAPRPSADEDAELWAHLAWAASDESRPSIDVSRTAVLGRPAVVVGFGDGQYDELVWVDADFVYWLRSWAGESGPPLDASMVADRINLDGEVISDRNTVQVVSGTQTIALMLLLAVVIAIVASAGYFLVRGPRILALVIGWTVFLVLWGTSENGWLSLGLSVVVLVGVWVLRSVLVAGSTGEEAESLGQAGGADPG